MTRRQHILLWLTTLALCGGVALGGNGLFVPPDWLVTLVDANGTSVISGGAVKVTGGGGGGSSQVEGRSADGVAAVGNPVQTGGVDGSGNAQAFLTDTTGKLQVLAQGPNADNTVLTAPVSIGGRDQGSGFTRVPYVSTPALDTNGTGSTVNLYTNSYGYAINGSNQFERLRTANAAANTTGTGLQGAGLMGFDGTNWQYCRTGIGNGGVSNTNTLYTQIGISSGTNAVIPWAAGSQAADGNGATTYGAVCSFRFNETNFDRERGNTQITGLASAARTAQADSADLINYNNRGIIIYVDVTTGAATPVVTPTLQMKDSITGNYRTIWTAAAAITSTAAASYVYELYPGVSGTAGFTEVGSIVVPRTYRLRFTVGDTDSLTYSASVASIQ